MAANYFAFISTHLTRRARSCLSNLLVTKLMITFRVIFFNSRLPAIRSSYVVNYIRWKIQRLRRYRNRLQLLNRNKDQNLQLFLFLFCYKTRRALTQRTNTQLIEPSTIKRPPLKYCKRTAESLKIERKRLLTQVLRVSEGHQVFWNSASSFR